MDVCWRCVPTNAYWMDWNDKIKTNNQHKVSQLWDPIAQKGGKAPRDCDGTKTKPAQGHHRGYSNGQEPIGVQQPASAQAQKGQDQEGIGGESGQER